MAATMSLQRSGSSLHRASPGQSPRLQHLHSFRSGHAFHHEKDGSSSLSGLDVGVAESAEASARTAIEEFEKDAVFSKFLSDDFNATQFASDALSSGSAAASSEKLEEGIQLLEKQLRSEVFLRHDELLKPISSLKETESVLAVVRSGVDSLQASVGRVRSEIADPYKSMKAKSRQLSSLHETVELLRSVTRVLKHLKKLREIVEVPEGAKIDLSKAAQLFNEVETVRREADLSGIDVIDEQASWLSGVGNRIRSEAMKGLESGMESLNQLEVGSFLQVFYNMGELKTTVENLITKYKSQAGKSVGVALDMKAISASVGSLGGPGGIQRSGTPQLGGTGRARDALWQRMATCMDQLHSILIAVWHLQRVLSKKRDPISHLVFLEEVVQAGDPMLTDRVWEWVGRTFSSQMKSAFTASSFVKETFVLGYPKLLSMVDSLLERLLHVPDVKGVSAAIKPEDKDRLIEALEPYQTEYLVRCHKSLSDLVHGMFVLAVRGSIPTQEHFLRLVSRIQEEVEAVKTEERLTVLVLREVGKNLQLFAEKAEYQVSVGADSRQVTGPANSLQLKNFALCLQLQEVHSRLTSRLPSSAAEVLSSSLGAVHRVASDCIAPLFKAMVERLESIILQVHDLNFGSTSVERDSGGSSSSYMEEFQKTVILFRSEFLAKLLPGSLSTGYSTASGDTICAGLARKMASRVLLFFVRHAALIRPLSEAGKLKLARDMAELELVVGQNLFPVEQLGSPYRALRAFKPFIFLETNQIENSPLLQELPPSAILHHLYSRAPEELESPMKQAKLPPAEYSKWLDSNGEEAAWKNIIKVTLNNFSAKVRARGDKEFPPVYPLMVQLGTSLLEPNGQIKG